MIAKIRYKPTKCLATFWAGVSLHDTAEKERIKAFVRLFYTQRLKMSEVFTPPKAKLLFITYSPSMWRPCPWI